MSPILPCPFCGGKASIINSFGEWWGLCEKCAASGAGAMTKRGAKKAWNSRCTTTNAEIMPRVLS